MDCMCDWVTWAQDNAAEIVIAYVMIKVLERRIAVRMPKILKRHSDANGEQGLDNN